MALLYRFTHLNDRNNTGIFTFIVTKSVIRDPHRDATTKDFIYGYHRWAITFTRLNEKSLGVYLILRNPCANSKCYADYSFTLLNKEHFSKNECFSDKLVCFTVERPAQGIGNWILLSDISSRKFSDETGEMLLELSLSNILTLFEIDLNVTNPQKLHHNFKLETDYIQYGGFDWNLSVKPLLKDLNSNEEFINLNEQTMVNVFLNRLSCFDRLVRVKYRLYLGNGKRKEDSSILDQISDGEGRIVGTQINLNNLIEVAKSNKNTVRFFFEMYCANLISEAKVAIVQDNQPVTNCYDRNKQGWCIETDFQKEHLRLKLFFMDLHSVPRNHLRFISWNTYVVTKNTQDDSRESISVLNAPHSNYYITDGIDVGVAMDTDIESQTILQASQKNYLEDGFLTVHVEWIDSILLFNNTYHKYDDLARIHCHQMKREIAALYAENYSLERQLLSYQKSISQVNSRGTPQSLINVNTLKEKNAHFDASQSDQNDNILHHRVSDPYILDNLNVTINNLIKTGSCNQNLSSLMSPSHYSKHKYQQQTTQVKQLQNQIHQHQINQQQQKINQQHHQITHQQINQQQQQQINSQQHTQHPSQSIPHQYNQMQTSIQMKNPPILLNNTALTSLNDSICSINLKNYNTNRNCLQPINVAHNAQINLPTNVPTMNQVLNSGIHQMPNQNWSMSQVSTHLSGHVLTNKLNQMTNFSNNPSSNVQNTSYLTSRQPINRYLSNSSCNLSNIGNSSLTNQNVNSNTSSLSSTNSSLPNSSVLLNSGIKNTVTPNLIYQNINTSVNNLNRYPTQMVRLQPQPILQNQPQQKTPIMPSKKMQPNQISSNLNSVTFDQNRVYMHQ